MRRTALAAAAVVATLGASGAADGVAATATPKHKPVTKVVIVGSDFYNPGKVRLRLKDAIRFKWQCGIYLHNVYVERGPDKKWHSPTQCGGTYRHVFVKSGTYKLFCTLHDMTMTVVVAKR